MYWGDSKIEENSTEVVNRHPGEVGGSRKLTMVSKYRSLGSKTLFTWSGGPRSSGVSFFCFVSPRA